ncbi:2582_t:CDS:2, partial [Cetraspora pellucida]
LIFLLNLVNIALKLGEHTSTKSIKEIFNIYDINKESTINSDSSIETLSTKDEEINMKYCHDTTCKFIFPYFHQEQETRVNIHTRVYIHLARALNRTMVLANVGNSNVRACSPNSFDFYYDTGALQEQYPDIRFITQDRFSEWSKERKISPITQHSWMIQDGRNDSLTVREKKTMEMDEGIEFGIDEKKSFCLDKFNLNITNYKEFHTGIVEKPENLTEFYRVKLPKFREEMLNFVINNLKTPQMMEHEVIMILNKSPRIIFPEVDKVIPYSPYIIDQSKNIRSKLKTYIAIHWRMEEGDPILMPECAERLITKVKRIQKLHKIKNVYLATDFPINGGKAQSQTFLEISDSHKKAMEILGLNGNSSVNNNSNHQIKFNTWVSMNGFSQIRNHPKYETEFNGAGIHGILDKLICIQADYFLSGPKGCARLDSSFTRAILMTYGESYSPRAHIAQYHQWTNVSTILDLKDKLATVKFALQPERTSGLYMLEKMCKIKNLFSIDKRFPAEGAYIDLQFSNWPEIFEQIRKALNYRNSDNCFDDENDIKTLSYENFEDYICEDSLKKQDHNERRENIVDIEKRINMGIGVYTRKIFENEYQLKWDHNKAPPRLFPRQILNVITNSGYDYTSYMAYIEINDRTLTLYRYSDYHSLLNLKELNKYLDYQLILNDQDLGKIAFLSKQDYTESKYIIYFYEDTSALFATVISDSKFPQDPNINSCGI